MNMSNYINSRLIESDQSFWLVREMLADMNFEIN